MKIKKLLPNQIITLNDYPVYDNDVLVEYFEKISTGEAISYVLVIRKDIVIKHFDEKLSKLFEEFAFKNPAAEYFMIDGTHRTTALTLAGEKIKVVIFEENEDIIEAKKHVEAGQILENETLNYDIVGNCKILNDHFSRKPFFMTVKQKTDKMLKENLIPERVLHLNPKGK